MYREDIDFVLKRYKNLFGHIHGRSFAKRNGFDLGIDYHRYSPINLEQVRWFAVNGMPHWDENVFSERANTVRA